MNPAKHRASAWIVALVALGIMGCSTIQPHGRKKEADPAARGWTEKIADLKVRWATLFSRYETDHLAHTVKWPGENLSSISRWYTGSSNNWPSLARANPGVDPRRIQIGETIRIPERLLRTRRPLPYEFLLSTARYTSPPTPSPRPPAPAADAEFYGPIDIESPNDAENGPGLRHP